MKPTKIGLYIAEILYRVGGTESYTVKLAQTLQSIYPQDKIYFVTELFNKKDMLSDFNFVDKLNTTYGSALDKNRIFLKPVKCSKSNFLSRRIMYKKIQNASKGFDLFFYCSVGTFAFKAKKNIAIVHFPAKKIVVQKKEAHKFDIPFITAKKDKKYIATYDWFLPNSKFTETWLKTYWPEIPEEKIKTIYHPVIPIEKLNLTKERIIIACGRIEKSKCLEVLIDAFKKSEAINKEYKFCIVGAAGKDEDEYFAELKSQASGYDIEFICNASRQTLTELYNKATIFWHAKGVGEENPYKTEHFGMTTVEAMSAGCVPVVINKAGQKEIVTEDCGFKWNTADELVEMTEKLIKNEGLLKRFSENAIARSEEFSEKKFITNMCNLLGTTQIMTGGGYKYLVFIPIYQEEVAYAA